MSAGGLDATDSELEDSHFPLDRLFNPDVVEPNEIAPTIGRFSILHKLGQGGMGVVYLGYDARLDRRAAIKLLRSHGASELGRARLLREAQALARLSHPNVVPVYESGEHGEYAYIAMEYVAGPTLRAWLRTAPRTMAEILEVFVAAGRGLAAAHDQGLTHRDFKPDNVMVGDDGRARVMDFGLVRTIDDSRSEISDSAVTPQNVDLTATGALLGTPAYMAPEQYRGGRTSPQTDQFSFCVALWEALYGTRPFAGKTSTELATRIVDGRITAPATDANVPASLRKALERGMASEPENRWPSMGTLLTVLEAELRSPRRPMVVAVAIAIVAALVSAAGFAWQKTTELRELGAEKRVILAEQQALQSLELLDEGNGVDALTLAIQAAAGLADESGSAPAKLPGKVARALHEASSAELSWGAIARFPGFASAVSFSPDDTHLALAQDVKLWGIEHHFIEIRRIDDGAVAATLTGHRCFVADMEFSADATRLSTRCAEDGGAHEWDTASGSITNSDSRETAATLDHADAVASAGFADGSGRLATVAADQHVRIWSESGELVRELVPGAGQSPGVAARDVHGLVVAPDGSRAALYVDRRMWLWDVATGELIHHFVDPAINPLDNDNPWVVAVNGAPLSLSPDGSRMVVRRHDGSILLLDANSGAALAETRRVTMSYSFSPDGTVLAVATDGVEIWDSKTGRRLRSLDSALANITVFSPSGDFLAIRSKNAEREWGIDVIDTRSVPSSVVTLSKPSSAVVLAIAPEGGRFVTADEHTTTIWDAGSGQRLATLDGHAQGARLAAFSRDGRVLGTIDRDGILRVWDTQSGQLATDPIQLEDSVTALAVSDDGAQVALTSGGRVSVRNVQSTAPVVEFDVLEDKIKAIAFSPNGRLLATVGYELRIWSLPAGELIRVSDETGSSVSFSPDGSRVSTDEALLDAATRVLLHELEHLDGSSHVVFSPDGTLLSAGGQLWNGFTGDFLGSLAGHERPVQMTGFLADGARIVTVSRDSILVRDAVLPLAAACARLRPYAVPYAEVAEVCGKLPGHDRPQR